MHCATMSRPHHGAFIHEQIHCERRPLPSQGGMAARCTTNAPRDHPSTNYNTVGVYSRGTGGSPFPKNSLGRDGTEIQKLTGKPDKIVFPCIHTMIC